MKVDTVELLAQARTAGWAMEPVARRFLADHGVPGARFAWARTADEAAAAAADIGYPVVAKVVSPQVVHKTDVGGVEVGMQIRMMFRVKEHDNQRGFTKYFWKAAPALS